MAYLDKTGLTYFWSKVKASLSTKADLVNGKVPMQQLSNEVATKSEIEAAISSLDAALSAVIGSGVLE